MAIKVTCRIAEGATRPGELIHEADSSDTLDGRTVLVQRRWTLDTRATWDETKQATIIGDALVTVEIWLPDDSAWTGKAYVTNVDAHPTSVQCRFPVDMRLDGAGPLTPKAGQS